MEDLIKDDLNVNLQTIFISIKYEELSLLEKILKTPQVPKEEKELVKKFVQLCKETKSIIGKSITEKVLQITFSNAHKTVSNVSEYIDYYITCRKRDKIAKEFQEISQKVIEDGLNSDIRKRVKKIMQNTDISDYKKMTALQFAQKCEEENHKGSNITTCVKELDKKVGGIPKGKMTSILGYTGYLKSTWAINIAYAAQLQGLNTLYLSLEMSEEDILSDLISRHSNQKKFSSKIEHRFLKEKNLLQEELKALKEEIGPDYDNLPRKSFYSRKS